MGGYGVDDSNQGLPFGRVKDNSLADQVAVQLFNAITSGLLQPGEKVVETTLSRQMDVSRAPIREATRMLVERGILVQIPRRGVFVREYCQQEIEEINELRLLIETGSLARAMDGGYMLQLDVLEKSLVERCDTTSSFVLKREFAIHSAIVQLYPNSRFLKAFDNVADELRVALASTAFRANTESPLIFDYTPLVRAIRTGDKERAINLLTESIRGFTASTSKVTKPSESDSLKLLKPDNNRFTG